jgi:hypothetical protein
MRLRLTREEVETLMRLAAATATEGSHYRHVLTTSFPQPDEVDALAGLA